MTSNGGSSAVRHTGLKGRRLQALLGEGVDEMTPENESAATALAYGYAMLTHNIRHFERVPGLVVQRPD